MLIELAVTVLLVGLTIAIHYEALRTISGLLPSLTLPKRARIIVVMLGAFLAHTIEILLFTLAYYVLVHHLGTGSIKGVFDGSFYDYFYFSISTYTSLGIGDVYPEGKLRLLAGMQTLTGLMMITWTASFAYLEMRTLWGSR